MRALIVPLTLALLSTAVNGSEGPANPSTVTRPDPLRKPASTQAVRKEVSSSSGTAVMREGTYLVDRTGRLTRTPDGQSWEFTPDPDASAKVEGAVGIVPNLNLMLMETAVAANTRDVRFKITGMVTEYRGRNFVLLQKVVVVPEAAPGATGNATASVAR